MESDLQEYWQPIIDELLKSGISRRKFALKKNLPPTKVNYWAYKLMPKSKGKTFKKENLNPKSNPTSKFVAVEVTPNDQNLKLLPDPKWLATFIKEISR